MNTSNMIHLNKITVESLSPHEFVRLKPTDKANISHAEVIPARLGQKDFGKIKIHYRRPVYK